MFIPIFTLVEGQMYIFDQMAINMVLLFHMHNEGPIIVFMQNGKDFFIYFRFYQNINFSLQFVTSPFYSLEYISVL